MLLEQALAAVGVTPQIAVQTAAREAIVPLVLAGAGAALLPTPLAREAQRRGAIARSAQPAITRTVGLIHRQGRSHRQPARSSRSPPAVADRRCSLIERRCSVVSSVYSWVAHELAPVGCQGRMSAR
jgi:DNA-binding transcriptional LysR family regulator